MFKYIITLLVMFLSLPCYAQTCFFSESVSVGSTSANAIHATALAEPNLIGVFVSVETSSIRYWISGTTPTSTIGHILYPENSCYISGINNCRNLSYISVGTSSVSLSYFRR